MARKSDTDYNDGDVIEESALAVPEQSSLETDNIILPPEWEFDANEAALVYGPDMQQYGLGFPMYKLTDCENRRIVVLACKSVRSDFPGSPYYYFVRALFDDTQERFNTVIGGKALMDVLDIAIAQRITKPVSFIPMRKTTKGGRNYWYPQ